MTQTKGPRNHPLQRCTYKSLSVSGQTGQSLQIKFEFLFKSLLSSSPVVVPAYIEQYIGAPSAEQSDPCCHCLKSGVCFFGMIHITRIKVVNNIAFLQFCLFKPSSLQLQDCYYKPFCISLIIFDFSHFPSSLSTLLLMSIDTPDFRDKLSPAPVAPLVSSQHSVTATIGQTHSHWISFYI